MANTLIQLRVNDVVKTRATGICEELGFDLQTYLRMAINSLIQEEGVPFSLKINKKRIDMEASFSAINEMQRTAEERGLSDMTLEEINAEIAQSRKESL